MGDAGAATIINFMALGAFRPDGTVDDKKMATLPADPKLKEKATAANALVDPKAVARQPDAKPGPDAVPVVCKDPDEMEGLANYIAGEMNRNILSSEVLEMQRLNNYDPASPDREPPRLTGSGGLVARALNKYRDTATSWAIWTGCIHVAPEPHPSPIARRTFVAELPGFTTIRFDPEVEAVSVELPIFL
jgi:hypothetical protein